MATTTELYTCAKLNDTNLVAILLTEESDSTKLLSLLDWVVTIFLERNVLANLLVYDMLYLTNLLWSHLLEVREVKAETFWRNERTLLLNVCAEHFTKCLIEKVSTSVVSLCSTTTLYIDASHELCLSVLWEFIYDVDSHTILLLCVKHCDCFFLRNENTAITYFTTHFTIERSLVENHLVCCTLLLLHLTVLDDVARVFCIVITNELTLCIAQNNPVAEMNLSSVASTSFLFLHLYVESVLIHCHALLTADKFSKVEWETKCIEESKCLFTSNLCLASSLCLINHALKEFDAIFKSAEE